MDDSKFRKSATRDAIVQAAAENGIDPATALAIAERESNFNPRARSSKTIEGIYQMRGDLRAKYGVPDGADAATQARGWGKFFADTKAEMADRLGRDPTDAEGYLGHHFGAGRAAQMLKMDPATPVDQVFSPYEMSINPHFAKAGTVGNLNSTVMADVGKRSQRYGAELPDLADEGTPLNRRVNPMDKGEDLASFGTPLASNGTANLNTSAPAASSAPDLSSFGTLA